MNAENISIECEEDGFHLAFDAYERDENGKWTEWETHNFRITFPEALHEQVNLIIGSWLAEGDRARHSVRVTREDLDGYDLYDPKRKTLEILLDGKDEVIL